MVSYKTKHTLNIWCSNRIPWYLPKWAENLHPHKNLCTSACSSFTTTKTWKQPRCPLIDEWTNVHSYNGILLVSFAILCILCVLKYFTKRVSINITRPKRTYGINKGFAIIQHKVSTIVIQNHSATNSVIAKSIV